MLGIFYGEEDKREIQDWIKKGNDTLGEEIRQQLNNFFTIQQFAQYDAEFRSQIEILLSDKLLPLSREINAMKMAMVQSTEVALLQKALEVFKEDIDTLKKTTAPLPELDTIGQALSALQHDLGNLNALKQAVAALQRDIADLKQPAPLPDVDALKQAVATLQKDIADLRQPPASPDVDALKQAVAILQRDIADLKQPTPLPDVDALKQEVATLQKDIVDLKQPAPLPDVDALKQAVATLQKDVADLRQPTPLPDVDALKQAVATLQRDIVDLRQPAPSPDVDALKQEVATLQRDIADLRQPAPSPDVNVLKQAVATLQKDIVDLKQPAPSPDVDALKQAVATLQKDIVDLRQPAPLPDVDALKQAVATLQRDIVDLRQPAPSPDVDALKQAVATLQRDIADLRDKLSKPTISEIPVPTAPETIEPETTAPEPPEKIFFLPTREDVFIPNEREKISEQIRQALNVNEIEKYLSANPSATSKKFRKLLDGHTKEVKKFVGNLKANILDDAELSEVITAKYFKLFQRTIFDNLLIGIKRGLKNSDKFYLGLLEKVNEYLKRCGIYTLNVTSGRKVESEDYDNMTPQILKTNDKTLTETISEIERLPYRINYFDEFGEQRYFQHSGIMSVYKAV